MRVLVLCCIVLFACLAHASQDGELFKLYEDPSGRFSVNYPATMQVRSSGQDDVTIYHPQVSFRISVVLESRKPGAKLTAEDLLAASMKKLEDDATNISVLGQGKLPGLKGSQAYAIVSYTDKRGLQLVQLVQYYVARERILQMTISDRPAGFKNLSEVVGRIHQSLKILKPELL